MEKRACIYCGTTEQLTNSDIIPDALTNAKIINPNVCKIAHNSRFSDDFESAVIEQLAIITNLLDVKSSKGKNYARYPMTFIVGSDEYSTIVSSDTEMFQKINSSVDGKSKIGPLEKILKISGASEATVNAIDINKVEIEKRVKIGLQVFFSNKMNRLITKIAFEWYCLHNNVHDKIDAFSDIISFITTGEGTDPVQFVGNEELYKALDLIESFGSHTLIAYIGLDNSVNIVVSLFGIAIYNVRLLPNPIGECKNNCIFQELSLDSRRRQFCFMSYNELLDNFVSATKQAKPTGININGLNIQIEFLDDKSFEIKNMYIECYSHLQSKLMCVSDPTPETVDLLSNRIGEILQASALTLRGLKRFVQEHKIYWQNNFKLNPECGDKKTLFLYYILFITGTYHFSSFKELSIFLKRTLGKTELGLTDEIVQNFEREIFSKDDYQSVIINGSKHIEEWKYE